MKITTDTTEWDAFVAEVLRYAASRPDVRPSVIFGGGSPVFAIVGRSRFGDVTVTFVPEQHTRARFEQLLAREPTPDTTPLTIGDRCMLKSGGPVMTVIEADDEAVIVAWHVAGKVDGSTFLRVTVRRVAP